MPEALYAKLDQRNAALERRVRLLGGTWYHVDDPTTGWLASKTTGWTAFSFSGGLQVDFSIHVPRGTKAVRIVIAKITSAGTVWWRKDGDTNIDNDPSTAGEVQQIAIATDEVNEYNPAVIWLSAAYLAQFAVSNVNEDIYISHPVEYLM
jgi:hypothetical protein